MSGIKSPDGGYPRVNGRTPTTPFQQPLPPLPVGHDIPVLPSPSTPPDSTSDEYTSAAHQTPRLIAQIGQLSAEIGVFYPTGGVKLLADSVAASLRAILSGEALQTVVLEMKRDGPHWLTTATGEKIKFYVFVGLPPARSRTIVRQNSQIQEDDFFNPFADEGHRVSRIVFIDPVATTPSSHKSSSPKHIKAFLHLNGALAPDELAIRILGHYGATQPAPYTIDNAYWSKAPKLINVSKDRPSLGITLVTREMSPDSAFPRIALIKALNEDCVSDLRRRVGRYTHIQSINGCFLDGFSIKNISAIFQTETKKDSVQLMVRFIHSRSESKRPSHLTSPQDIPSAAQLDPTREDLPVPLFILSDNHEMAQNLFQWLTTDVGPRRNSSLQIPPTPGTQMSGDSFESDPKFVVGGRTTAAAPEDQGEMENSLKRGTVPNKVWFPASSDPSMRRASVSSNYFTDQSPTTPMRPDFKRMFSINSQNIASRHYIPQMFSKSFERRFAHIFLRTSGLYLVTAWFKDLADDPLIQFENISYWLRLIQQRTGCADEKRAIIVGMYNSQDKEDIDQIRRYVGVLNEALQESELNRQLFDQNRRMSGVNTRQQHSYVFMFDLSRYVDCCYELYERIEMCMDLFAEKAFYYYPSCFEKVFKAFDGLNVALRELSSLAKIVVSLEDLKTLCKHKPEYALETLQSYSPALIDPSIDGLLKPHFLINLMNQLGSSLRNDQSIYDVFKITVKPLNPLPVVSKPWPIRVMDDIASTMSDIPINEHDKDVVIQWAEKLGLMFRIEGDQRKSVSESFYYVPSMATDMMAENAKFHWDNEKEKHYRSDKATVLYAFFHFPCNHQFFDRLVAVLLNEGFKKRQDLFINRGCMEAILPLCLKEQRVLTVMLIYHPLQNAIEFRTRINTAMKLSFLDAVREKLDIAFASSIFSKLFSFADSVAFHVPSSDHEEKLKHSALWKLKELEVAQAEDEDEKAEAESKLLKTKELTAKVMEDWAASHPQMKEINPELFLRWSRKLSSNDDHWSLVGAKLHLLTVDDINYLKNNANKGGNGVEVLTRWQDSDMTVQELTSALREVKLLQLAQEIEEALIPGSDV